MPTRRSAWWVVAAELMVLGVLVSAVIARYDNPTIHTDESYHLMCSRSLNAGEGLPNLGGGPYRRAWVFSYAVAYSQAWFGDSLTAARLPAIASTVALVLAVFGWLRARADTSGGRVAAWAAALLLGLSVLTIDTAQFCRFYSMHALVAFVMAVAVYEALRPQTSRGARAAWTAIALAAAPLGFHLQETTAVVVLALGTYAGLVLLWTLWTTPRFSGRGKLIGLGALAAACIAGVALLMVTGLWDRAIYRFTWAPYWHDPEATVWYYHKKMMMPRYALLWALTPVALLVALARAARLTIFAAVFFTVSMVVMSLSSVHAARYVSFAMPLLFVVWGLAVSGVVRPLHRGLVRRSRRWATTPPTRRAVASAWALVIMLVLAYGAYRTPAYYRTLRAVRSTGQVDAIIPWGDYAGAIAAIERAQPGALDVSFVLAAPKAKAMYYFPEREMLLLGKADTGDRPRMIVDVAELHEVMARHPQGLIIVDGYGGYWRDPRFVTAPLADAIEAAATRLPAPKDAGVHFFRWDATAR